MFHGQLTTYKMKKNNIKYISLIAIMAGFTACNDIEDVLEDNNALPIIEVAQELNPGSVDFSNYVALGASFTAGFTDSALFIAGQENSFPNILSKAFSKAGGGDFVQPLVNDNYGGLAVGGTRISDPRLVFGGAGPVPLESVVGDVVVTTDLTSNPTGPFGNLGVPGAKSFHLLGNGYGNIANFPLAANPYAIRLTGSTPDASILELAMAQSPTFFTLSEIGGNDVLGYAISGGDDSDIITDTAMFDYALTTLVTTLTSGGAKGIVTNVPYIADLPHFTTVPHNPIPLDAATAGFLNSALAYGKYNAGIAQAFAYLVSVNAMTQEDATLEIAKRTITFVEGEGNAVVIMDEDLTDLTTIDPALVSMRQATEADLFVLPAASFIGTEAVAGNPQTVNGVAIPLADKWVLTPEEQMEVKAATDAYNATISSVASSNENIALVDLNAILTELSSTGITFGDYKMTSDLVTGGAVSLDGIHLTARGYSYMAYKFLEAIDRDFGSNFIESGNGPTPGDYPTNYSALLQ